MTPEDYEKQKKARADASKGAKDEQLGQDLAALAALEEQHGDGRVARLDLPAFVQGLPTMVVVRAPEALEYKCYRTEVRKAGKNLVALGKAADDLALACRVYPSEAIYEKVSEKFPGIRDSMIPVCMKLAEALSGEPGKG